MITNAPQWCWSCCFLLGGHILTWGTKTSLGADFALTFGGEKKTKQKGLDYKCTPMVLVLLLSFGGTIFARLGGPEFSLKVMASKWPPWHRACMDVYVGNLLHWFYSLDVIWCFFSKNLMFLNNGRWHHWLLNKNGIGFKKWFSLVILCKYCVVAL